MTLRFLLLGPFACEWDFSGRKLIGDSLAAKIVAYLAYQNRFCSHTEIIQNCWTMNVLTKRDTVDEDAYRKQIYFVHKLFNEEIGLPWKEFFFSEPNGAQLREGTFTTDVVAFDTLLAANLDIAQPESSRLATLQRAERLSRGYLLDGMNCSWITSKAGGARREYSDKMEQVRHEVRSLKAAEDAVIGQRVYYYKGFHDAIPALRQAIAEAAHEIVFHGMDLRLTIPVLIDLLYDRLRAGVRITFHLLDPEGHWTKDLAYMIGDGEQELREECSVSLRRLASLSKQLSNNGVMPGLEVSLYDGMIPARTYAIDPEHAGGRLFYFPYAVGTLPTQLPCYVWPHRENGPFTFYAANLRKIAMESYPIPATAATGVFGKR